MKTSSWFYKKEKIENKLIRNIDRKRSSVNER
jgi:hypothetical protein